MSWNIVLNKFITIKQEFMHQFPGEAWNYGNDTTCLEYWVNKLNIPQYKELIKPLELNEYNGMLLIRYGNYSDIFSGEEDISSFWDINDGFYSECRSIVIDIRNDALVLTPFRKFRNVNESEDMSVDKIRERIQKAHNVEISNKLDGSMQSARWYQGAAIMAGSQALEPENSWRLQDGYHMLQMTKDGCFPYYEMLSENPDITFIFEYISLKDAHVVKYTKEQEGLYLIGMRNVNTGIESSYADVITMAKKYDIPTTEVFNRTFEDVFNDLDAKTSDEAEGFVINIDGWKCKLKYNDYVQMHKILSSLSSPNLVLQAIEENRFDDFLSKVPEAYKPSVLQTAEKVFAYINGMSIMTSYYYEAAPKTDVKTFMCWVTENVPQIAKSMVRNKYLGKETDVLKMNGGFLKYNALLKNLDELKKYIWNEPEFTKDEE